MPKSDEFEHRETQLCHIGRDIKLLKINLSECICIKIIELLVNISFEWVR